MSEQIKNEERTKNNEKKNSCIKSLLNLCVLFFVGLSHLIGTNLLRAYMHGFFIDIKLYHKVRLRDKGLSRNVKAIFKDNLVINTSAQHKTRRIAIKE